MGRLLNGYPVSIYHNIYLTGQKLQKPIILPSKSDDKDWEFYFYLVNKGNNTHPGKRLSNKLLYTMSLW